MNQKENGNTVGKQSGKIQHIEPYLKTDHPVTRKTDDEGRVVYFRRHGTREEVPVCEADLMSEILCLFEGIKAIEFIAREQEQFTISTSLSAIRTRFENGIDEMFRFIEQEVGEIKISIVTDSDLNSPMRFRQVVGASLQTPNGPIETPVSDPIM